MLICWYWHVSHVGASGLTSDLWAYVSWSINCVWTLMFWWLSIVVVVYADWPDWPNWLTLWNIVFDPFSNVGSTLLMCYFCCCYCLLYVFACGVLMLLNLFCTSCKLWYSCFDDIYKGGDCYSFCIYYIMQKETWSVQAIFVKKDTRETKCFRWCATFCLCQHTMMNVIMNVIYR